MNDKVYLLIPISRRLRTEFKKYAAAQDKPMTDLIRDYIKSITSKEIKQS